MDLEQQQPALYHRYNVDEGDEEEEDEDGGVAQDSSGTAWGAEMITEAILGMDLADRAQPGDGDDEDEGEGDEQQRRQTLGNSQGQGGHEYGELARRFRLRQGVDCSLQPQQMIRLSTTVLKINARCSVWDGLVKGSRSVCCKSCATRCWGAP